MMKVSSITTTPTAHPNRRELILQRWNIAQSCHDHGLAHMFSWRFVDAPGKKTPGLWPGGNLL
jgi:hypothetical protein